MTTKTFEKIGLTLDNIIKQSDLDTVKSLYGDLLITTSEIAGNINNKYTNIDAGTPVMLLSVQLGRNPTATLLMGDREVNTYSTNKFAYLEHGDALEGISLCITGKLEHTRDYYETLIKFQGGTFKKAMNSSVDYLVVGRDVGQTKLHKAKSFNIPTLSEKEFHQLIIDNKKKKQS